MDHCVFRAWVHDWHDAVAQNFRTAKSARRRSSASVRACDGQCCALFATADKPDAKLKESEKFASNAKSFKLASRIQSAAGNAQTLAKGSRGGQGLDVRADKLALL